MIVLAPGSNAGFVACSKRWVTIASCGNMVMERRGVALMIMRGPIGPLLSSKPMSILGGIDPAVSFLLVILEG
jgi:hypothetical protein